MTIELRNRIKNPPMSPFVRLAFVRIVFGKRRAYNVVRCYNERNVRFSYHFMRERERERVL